MPRGGKRPCAGRKSTLDDMEKHYVALEVQERIRSLCENNRERIENEEIKNSRIRDLPNVNSIEKGEKRIAYEQSLINSDEQDTDLPENVLDAADNLKERREFLENNPKLRKSTYPRLYGYKKKLFEDVSIWASACFDKKVTPRMVESCWKRYVTDFKSDL